MIPFYQVECPKCHGQLNSITPMSGQTACPFCGTTFHITANLSAEIEAPSQIVPFATSAHDFAQAAHAMIAAGDYAPEDISALIPFDLIRGFYLPVYLYRGSYECAWSCRVKEPATDPAAENRKAVYRPQNGLIKGDYAFACMAHEGVETGRELAEYVHSLNSTDSGNKTFVSDDLSGYFFVAHNRDQQKVWRQWGNETLNQTARRQSLMQLQSNDVKDFKCSVSAGASPEGKPMFFPVWIANYQYDGQQHHIIMDGTGRTGVKGSTPVDSALKARAQKPFTILKFIALAAILIPLLLLLANMPLPAGIALAALAIVFFGYRTYARWNQKRIIRRRRRGI